MQTFDCFLKSNFAPKTFLSFLAFFSFEIFEIKFVQVTKMASLKLFQRTTCSKREREREKEKEKKRKIDIKRGKVSWRER